MKNGVEWLVCCALFAAGLVWGKLLPSGDFWSIKLDGVIAFVSSIATAAAAVAAWKAARINAGQSESAKSQAESASQQNRLQFYMQHWATFNEWINGIERDHGVSFYKRSALYDVIFPNNRDVSKPFSSVGSDELRSWQKTLRRILDRTCMPLDFDGREAEDWFFDHARLSGYMHYSYISPEQNQLVLGDALPSGISVENYDHVYDVMSYVLESLSKFAYCDGAPRSKGISLEVRDGVIRLINEAQGTYSRTHRYRKWKPFE